MFALCKPLDIAALYLIDPTVETWDIGDVITYPQAIHYVDLNSLSGHAWTILLDGNPEFQNKCTEYGGWAKMGGRDWSWFLVEQPQFEDICTKHNGWDKMGGWDWSYLLKYCPLFGDKCTEYGGWSKFNTFDWERLPEYPQFEKYRTCWR